MDLEQMGFKFAQLTLDIKVKLMINFNNGYFQRKCVPFKHSSFHWFTCLCEMCDFYELFQFIE